MATPFSGWSQAAFDFYRELESDNTRTFWLAHKAVYDNEVRAPFDALSELVAVEFGELKVFRPNRDVRFSKGARMAEGSPADRAVALPQRRRPAVLRT